MPNFTYSARFNSTGAHPGNQPARVESVMLQGHRVYANDEETRVTGAFRFHKPVFSPARSNAAGRRHEPCARDDGNGGSERDKEEEEEEKRRRGSQWRRCRRLLRPRCLPHPLRANHPSKRTRRRRPPPAPPSLPLAPGGAALPSPRIPRRAPAPPPLLQLAFRGGAELRGGRLGGVAVHGGQRDAGIRRRDCQWLGAGAGEWQPASGRGCLQRCDGSVGVFSCEGASLRLACSAKAIVKSTFGVVRSRTTKRQTRISEPNKYLCLIVDTVVLMVNSCKIDKLHNMQKELVSKAVPLLYEIWNQVRLLKSSADCNDWKDQLQSSGNEISGAIFRLSMDLAYPVHPELDGVRKSIFGQRESDFEDFVLTYWEKSPHLYKKKRNNLKEEDVFAALHNSFDLTTPDAIIESFIQWLVSCPAIASDELSINSFLLDVHDCLGAAVKYRQDVRVVRTQGQTSRGSGKEEHFFDDGTVFLDAAAFIEDCKDAFKSGFSIALRGMEFRSEKVAAIASALADLFGQPSVGANIYFSPSRSQGLARHYDDHCVLVLQLLGRKKWKIWPSTKSVLPRLYEPFDSLDGLVDDSGGRIEVLHEGDIMYVPRGYIHEAHTDVDEEESEVNASSNYSLHLTLAIEVESPFEWEGFAHIALHCWLDEQSRSVNSKVERQALLFALLLHVAIRLLSDNDPILRKACMVAAKLPSPSNSCAKTHPVSLRSIQRSTFAEILNSIDNSCNFQDALRSIEVAVNDRNDEPFQWMSWLRHLPQHGGGIDFCDVLRTLGEAVEAFRSNRKRASSGFTEFKSRFCRSVVFEDACQGFETLLQRYRTCRSQYMRGMLALHGRRGS